MVRADKVLRLLKTELFVGGYRLQVARCVFSFIPPYVGTRTRVRVLRLLGFRGIHPTVVFGGLPTLVGSATQLSIGRRCHFNVGCFFDLSNTIRFGANVSCGQQVMFLTETHKVGEPRYRAGELTSMPIIVGDGCWIGARATILPGVTIGEGAIIAAGAVVNRDVEPHTMVGGVPAKQVRELNHPFVLTPLR